MIISKQEEVVKNIKTSLSTNYRPIMNAALLNDRTQSTIKLGVLMVPGTTSTTSVGRGGGRYLCKALSFLTYATVHYATDLFLAKVSNVCGAITQ